jgi:hypothetical protein
MQDLQAHVAPYPEEGACDGYRDLDVVTVQAVSYGVARKKPTGEWHTDMWVAKVNYY